VNIYGYDPDDHKLTPDEGAEVAVKALAAHYRVAMKDLAEARRVIEDWRLECARLCELCRKHGIVDEVTR
jgi:hypothetical protein